MTQETETERYLRKSEEAFERLALALGLSRSATMEQIARTAEDKLEGFGDENLDDFRKIIEVLGGASDLKLNDNVLVAVEDLIERAQNSAAALKRLEELDLPVKKSETDPDIESLVEALAAKYETLESDTEKAQSLLDELGLVDNRKAGETPSLLDLVHAAVRRIEELENEQQNVRETLAAEAPAHQPDVSLQTLAVSALDQARTPQLHGELGRRIISRLGD